MSRIRIRHFGPIQEGNLTNEGWVDIKKVTIFIGNQGSGKSTVAKLISTFTWIEKALVRGDYDQKWFERKNKLRNQFLSYHRLEGYFQTDAESLNAAVIDYEGEAYRISYAKGSLTIQERTGTTYALPQIMYVPAERNFISYVRTPRELKLSSDSLKEFLTEFDNAKNELKGTLALPLGEVTVEYDKLNDTINLRSKRYKVKLPDASSGFQSLVPLYLVTRHLAATVGQHPAADREPMSSDELSRFKKGVADIWRADSLSDEQKRVALSVLSARFNKTAFINIVEEPEQNLFPASQWAMLRSLLEFNHHPVANRLILTTHSPFVINYLSIAIQAHSLRQKLVQAGRPDLLSRLERIVPAAAQVAAADAVVYQLDETRGSIEQLATYEGIPGDDNYLNQTLRQGNQLFDDLLALEEEVVSHAS